jgi:Spy/CpxP family protein refolding chaperone
MSEAIMRIFAFCALVLSSFIAAAQAPSPYAGQQTRDIKALSPQEVADLTSGRGMGLAKAAELNGYPGPAHVLEMREALELTPDQATKTQAVFDRMQSRAIAVGSELLHAERALDAQFASHTVTPETLDHSLARIAKLQGEVRQLHLQAHLDQSELLTAEQISRYNRLRGYSSGTADESAHPRVHH